MATKRIGISRDLIIHPGETIADVLEDRCITQAELARSHRSVSCVHQQCYCRQKGHFVKIRHGVGICLGCSEVLLAEFAGKL